MLLPFVFPKIPIIQITSGHPIKKKITHVSHFNTYNMSTDPVTKFKLKKKESTDIGIRLNKSRT